MLHDEPNDQNLTFSSTRAEGQFTRESTCELVYVNANELYCLKAHVDEAINSMQVAVHYGSAQFGYLKSSAMYYLQNISRIVVQTFYVR